MKLFIKTVSRRQKKKFSRPFKAQQASVEATGLAHSSIHSGWFLDKPTSVFNTVQQVMLQQINTTDFETACIAHRVADHRSLALITWLGLCSSTFSFDATKIRTTAQGVGGEPLK
jgi:hypothetical protein